MIFKVALILTILATPAMAGEIKTTYLYTLSDFYGPIPYNWVNFAVDETNQETYIADSSDKTVRVFNASGMEIYRFGDDGAFPRLPRAGDPVSEERRGFPLVVDGLAVAAHEFDI